MTTTSELEILIGAAARHAKVSLDDQEQREMGLALAGLASGFVAEDVVIRSIRKIPCSTEADRTTFMGAEASQWLGTNSKYSNPLMVMGLKRHVAKASKERFKELQLVYTICVHVLRTNGRSQE